MNTKIDPDWIAAWQLVNEDGPHSLSESASKVRRFMGIMGWDALQMQHAVREFGNLRDFLIEIENQSQVKGTK